jgi:hypothetical protein
MSDSIPPLSNAGANPGSSVPGDQPSGFQLHPESNTRGAVNNSPTLPAPSTPFLFHTTTSNASTDNIVQYGINRSHLNPNSRFGSQFYTALDPATTHAELAHHGAPFVGWIAFHPPPSTTRVLGLTNSALAQSVDYFGGPITPHTQQIGANAATNGFDAIKYYSERNPGATAYAFLNQAFLKPAIVTTHQPDPSAGTPFPAFPNYPVG